MSANDNSKKPSAADITRIANALFNKCSAIEGAHASDVDRLFGELGGLIARADMATLSRSKDANALLVKAKEKAHEVAFQWCERATA